MKKGSLKLSGEFIRSLLWYSMLNLGGIKIKPGSYRVSRDGVLLAGPVTSGVVVVLYSPDSGLGGMGYASFPDPNPMATGEELQKMAGKENLFVSSLLKNMASAMRAMGAGEIQSMVFGGAHFLNSREYSLGARNLSVLFWSLKSHGIQVREQMIGGHSARVVIFSIPEKKVEVLTLSFMESVVKIF